MLVEATPVYAPQTTFLFFYGISPKMALCRVTGAGAHYSAHQYLYDQYD